MHLDSFFIQIFIVIMILEIFLQSVILGWVLLVQIDLVKRQKEVVRIVRKGKNGAKRKKTTIAGLIQEPFRILLEVRGFADTLISGNNS